MGRGHLAKNGKSTVIPACMFVRISEETNHKVIHRQLSWVVALSSRKARTPGNDRKMPKTAKALHRLGVELDWMPGKLRPAAKYAYYLAPLGVKQGLHPLVSSGG